MSSIYLYIIYISRPWFKGSGGGRQVADPYQEYPFSYAPSAAMLYYTQIIILRGRESTAMVILLTFFFNCWGKRMRAKGF